LKELYSSSRIYSDFKCQLDVEFYENPDNPRELQEFFSSIFIMMSQIYELNMRRSEKFDEEFT
jgi:hypothetical protein